MATGGWEYHIVVLDWDVDGQVETLRALGRERWELVGIVVSPGDLPLGYLKRWVVEG